MKNVILVISLFMLVFIIVINIFDAPTGRYYNCRDIDFLPDVPPKVREECRRIIKERLDEQRKNPDRTLLHT
jgi:hypothetical protein